MGVTSLSTRRNLDRQAAGWLPWDCQWPASVIGTRTADLNRAQSTRMCQSDYSV